MKRIKKYFSIIKTLIYLFLLLIASSLGLFIINLIVNIILGLYTGEFDFGQDIIFDTPHLSSLLVEITMVVVCYIWYVRLKKKDMITKTKRLSLKDVGFLLLWGLGFTLLVDGLTNLLIFILNIYFPQLVSDYIDMMSSLYEGSLIIIALSVAIVGPIFEELVFRGIIFKKANDIMPFYAANIVQAILFALVHMNLIQIIYTFPVGIMLGYITMRYRSLVPAILLHILNNSISVLLVVYERTVEEPMVLSTWFRVVLALIGALVFVAGSLKIKRSTYIELDTAQEIHSVN